MFIDASALTAMATGEKDAKEIADRLEIAKNRFVSPLVIWETTVAMARILDTSVKEARRALNHIIRLNRIVVREIPPEATDIALDAFDRFGKGRHKAGLNFGDCFAYACAKHFRQPLMFKGGDFALTDIEAA